MYVGCVCVCATYMPHFYSLKGIIPPDSTFLAVVAAMQSVTVQVSVRNLLEIACKVSDGMT